MTHTSFMRRLAATVASVAVAAGLLVAAPPTAQAATWSPRTTSYCTGQQYCQISIAYSSGVEVKEGLRIKISGRFRASTSVSLRAYEVLYDAKGVSGFRAAGAAVSFTTDASGYLPSTASVPTVVLPAGALPGKRYVVQPSDISTHQIDRTANTWYLLGNAARTVEMATLYSGRGQVTKSTKYGTTTDPYYISTIDYGLVGDTYRAEAFRGGSWVNVSKAGITGNGVIRKGPLAQNIYGGSASLTWAVPGTWGTGVYPMRFRNVTKNIVVGTSSYALYYTASGIWGDHDGDRRADILGVDGSTGVLNLYVTRSGPSLSPKFSVQSGFGSTNFMATLPDMNGNKYSELITRRSDGTLWIYRQTDFGKYAAPVKVGSGWGGLSALTVMPDTNRDGYPELLARTTDGKLYRYRLTLQGASFQAQVGTGWNGIAKIIAPGDITRDGVPDILAVGSNGNLYRYAFGSNGQIISAAQVGHGWSSMTNAYSPGDMDGNGTRDLVAKRSDGYLFFYPVSSTGSIGSARQIGSGWGSIRLMA